MTDNIIDNIHEKSNYHSKITGLNSNKQRIRAASVCLERGLLEVQPAANIVEKWRDKNSIAAEEWHKKYDGVPANYYLCKICEKKCKSNIEFFQHFKSRHPDHFQMLVMSL